MSHNKVFLWSIVIAFGGFYLVLIRRLSLVPGNPYWFMAAFIALSFPYLAEKLGGGNTFLFFTVMMIAQLLFVWKMMPETKGKSLEQMGHTLVLH